MNCWFSHDNLKSKSKQKTIDFKGRQEGSRLDTYGFFLRMELRSKLSLEFRYKF